MEAGLYLPAGEAQPTERKTCAARLAWNGGRSVLWQVISIVLVWALLVALHPQNDGILTHIDVCRFLLPIKIPPQQELLFPILGSDKAYRVTSIGH